MNILTIHKPESQWSSMGHRQASYSDYFEHCFDISEDSLVSKISIFLSKRLDYQEVGYTAYVTCIENGAVHSFNVCISDRTGETEFHFDTESEGAPESLITRIQEEIKLEITERDNKERKEEEDRKNLENRRIAAQEKAELERLRKKYEGSL
jgi:hypothetical protein